MSGQEAGVRWALWAYLHVIDKGIVADANCAALNCLGVADGEHKLLANLYVYSCEWHFLMEQRSTVKQNGFSTAGCPMPD